MIDMIASHLFALARGECWGFTSLRTWRSNFCPHRIEACSRALTTLMYESCSEVYLPMRTMETVSKSRS
jgi:hypothetical protein